MNKSHHALLHAGSVLVLLSFAAIPSLGSPLSPATVAAVAPATLTAPITHIFLILMENHSYSQVWNTASSPYITALGKVYSYSANYHAITHPSLPNYLDLYAGSNYGITTDCSPSSSCHVKAWSLADNLDTKRLIWKFYEESMPAPCTVASSGTYAPKHDPVVYFDDVRLNATRCKNHVVPFSTFATNLLSIATTPNFSFITPNLCDDTHDCSVSTGDNWLKLHVPPILKSQACTLQHCLVIITWDEDNGSSGNHVLTVFAGSGARTGGYASGIAYNHYSLLRTVEYLMGVPTQTTHDASAVPMIDMLH